MVKYRWIWGLGLGLLSLGALAETMQIPPDRVPPQGLCRVWFRDVAPDRQPAATSCRQAHVDASRQSGLVIQADSPQANRDGQVQVLADYSQHFSRPMLQIPSERVPPLGQCRIWYRDIPSEKEPPSMRCERAHEQARRFGGLVLEATSPASAQNGQVAYTEYGPSPFKGIPSEQLPAPGQCKVWLDGLPSERQKGVMSCPEAEAWMQKKGGRVLYMPAP